MESITHEELYKQLAAELFKQDDDNRVFIVSGAPGSGKSTYVKNNKSANDIVLDLDELCAAISGTDIYKHSDSAISPALAARSALINHIAKRAGKWERAFIITTANQSEVNKLASKCNAKVIKMNTPQEKCIEQIKNDFRRSSRTNEFILLAKKWYLENS